MSRVLFHLERLCCALASWFPRVGVNVLTTWGIYVELFRVLPKIDGAVRWVLLVLAAFCYVNSTVAYARTVKTGPGTPLEVPGFATATRHGAEDMPDLEAGHLGSPPDTVYPSVTAKENGQMRFCTKCSCWKPDRAHHCSSCRRCNLRMDHHCPWFAVCIGFKNHKFFVQFLVYVSLLCIVCFASCLLVTVQFFANGDEYNEFISLQLVALLLVSGVMGLAVSLFSGFSVYLVLTNQTTLESLESVKYKSELPASAYRYSEAPDSRTIGNVFDLGFRENWRQVMGYKVYEWLLPIHPQGMGDGTSYPANTERLLRIREVAEQEARYLEQSRPKHYQQNYQQQFRQQLRQQYQGPQHPPHPTQHYQNYDEDLELDTFSETAPLATT